LKKLFISNAALSYHNGVFLKRYKRFFADVKAIPSGTILTLHCPNTGAMTGLLEEGVDALYSLATAQEMKKRKTPGTLEALRVDVGDRQAWVGVNTHRANQIAREWLQQPQICAAFDYRALDAEVPLGNLYLTFPDYFRSQIRQDFKRRVDFVGTGGRVPLLVEVKSATLYEDNQGYFPDCVSVRATQQLKELCVLKKLGFNVLVLYVSQHQLITQVLPAVHLDFKYAQQVILAKEDGVVFKTVPFQSHWYLTAND